MDIEEVIDTSTKQAGVDEPVEILILRGKYPEIVHHQNTNEDNWHCDICLSKENEEDDPLCVCDLCLVVVHPSCYRRDLYEQDPDDENPWYCARCNFLLYQQAITGKPLCKDKLPQCMLCNDLTGAMVDL